MAVIFSGVLMLPGLYVVREIASGVSNWYAWRTRLEIQTSLPDATVDRLHRLRADFHRKEGVGALMTRLDRGIQGFVSAISEISFNIIPSLMYLVTAVIIMFRLEWRLSLLTLVFPSVPAIIASLASPAQVSRERKLMEIWVKLYSRFNEVLSGLVAVRSFAMEDEGKSRFIGGGLGANRTVVKGVRCDSIVGASQNFMPICARVLSIGLGAWLITRGETTLGPLVAFLSYVGALLGPVQGLAGVCRTARLASASLDQIFGILDEREHLADAPDAADPGRLAGDVTFGNVRFSYDPSRKPLLGDIDFHVPAGRMIAIVGPRGAGKSTLMAMLQRCRDPDSGEILLDGRDPRTFRQKSVRRQIDGVLKDPHMVNDTVRNNIAYGRPGASFEEIVEAAKTANAHEFIMKPPDGYDTMLGDRASRLSGGERQRIAIARAIVKDPPILILDEARSAPDAELEEKVRKALESLVKGRTTFVIAHRLATVVNADRILVLRNGRLHEAGNHRDLLSLGGYYASLVRKQSRGLIYADAAS